MENFTSVVLFSHVTHLGILKGLSSLGVALHCGVAELMLLPLHCGAAELMLLLLHCGDIAQTQY